MYVQNQHESHTCIIFIHYTLVLVYRSENAWMGYLKSLRIIKDYRIAQDDALANKPEFREICTVPRNSKHEVS
jgi:hypothetical protein